MKSAARITIAMLVSVVSLAACGEAAPERDQIRLQANAVGGGQLYYEDLASEDTVLWFWAPW